MKKKEQLFCPIIKGKCKGEKCMWYVGRNEKVGEWGCAIWVRFKKIVR